MSDSVITVIESSAFGGCSLEFSKVFRGSL